LQILADKWLATWDVIDLHSPLSSRFLVDADQFEPSATGISTAQVYLAPDFEVRLTGIPRMMLLRM
jgi:hypothetical protein